MEWYKGKTGLPIRRQISAEICRCLPTFSGVVASFRHVCLALPRIGSGTDAACGE
jgi:hypothetical protein